jgi:phosphoenolpyruvate carboxykinase (GTP)
MLEFKKGVDILSAVGGITTIGEARQLFEQRLDREQLARLAKITNEEALLKVANAIAMCEPDAVYILTGSDEDNAFVRRMSLEKGEQKELAIPGIPSL